MKTSFPCADLFCGAGGTSNGLFAAAQELGFNIQLWAVNHWQIAISTHALNHAGVSHLLADIEAVDPRKVVSGGYLRFLVASPECTHHSRARGGKPRSDQKRATVNYILDWVRALTIDDLLIENVPEFVEWGPLYPKDYPDEKLRGLPIPARKGELFAAFIGALKELGYTVEHRILCAANYGDATTRRRFFLRASRHGVITWPKATHHKGGSPGWRPAREIINWDVPGTPISERNPPLCKNTMKRIHAGFRKFSGLAPFIIASAHTSDEGRVYSCDMPVPTLTTKPQFGLVQPYLVEYHGTGGAASIDEPLDTVTSKDRFGLVEPILVELEGKQQYVVDFRYRMLLPEEMAAAMSFPSDYQFVGNGEAQVKQIGNAVPCRLAQALCKSILEVTE